MLLGKGKANKGLKKRTKTLSAILLFLFYVTGNVQVESFHQVFHSLEKALHTSEQEKDPCHRAIYHDSKKESCDHKMHFTAVKKCPLCHVVPLNEQHIASGHSFESIYIPGDLNDYLLSIHVADNFINLPARAPPVF